MSTEPINVTIPVSAQELADNLAASLAYEDAQSFIITLDERIADADFTCAIIGKLVESIRGDLDDEELQDRFAWYRRPDSD